jgi:hypothetical protein
MRARVLALSLLFVPVAAQAQDARLAPTNDDVWQRTSAKRVTFDFDCASLREVLDFLEDTSGLVFVADAPLLAPSGPRVTLRLRDVSLKSAFSVLGASTECTFEVWHGSIYVTPKSAPSPRPPVADLPPAAAKVWTTKTVDLSGESRTVAEVLSELRKATGLPLSVDPAVKDATVSVRAKALPLGAAVDFACRAAGLKAVRLGDGVELVARAPGDGSAPEMGSFLEVKEAHDAARAKKAEEARLKETLATKKVSLEFKDAPLSTVVKSLSESLKLSFFVAHEVDDATKVTVDAKDVAAQDALAQVLDPIGCAYELEQGCVKIVKKKAALEGH